GADGGQGDTAAAEDTQVVDSTNNVYKTWTVTNMVADWVSTPSNNFGMLVNSDAVASVDSYRFFASTEDSNTSIRPKLIVTYSIGAAPPGQATNPSPAHSATNVDINADLSWTAGSGSTSSDVYFGTSSPGTFQGNQTATTFDPGTMANDTNYYWRIDEVNAEGTTTGNVWSFTTIVEAPGQASSPTPADSAVNVAVDADLSWTAGSGATSHDVYFGTSSPGSYQGNQTATTFEPGNMANDTTYYWCIDEVNAGGTTTGSVWSFTTESAPVPPPGQASNPSPADSAANVAVNTDLSWTAGSDTTSHDVYFGTTSPGSYQGNQAATTFDTGSMANDTTYYWRIDEVGLGGTTTGNVWSFTTIAAAPGQASNPSPGNGATDVSVNADLSWSGGSGATSHDVYFGTSSPGSFQGNQTATTFDTGTMSNDTTYYWRIDEVNAAGTTTGTVWNFTTIVAAPGQATNPGPADSATDVSVDADLSWTAGSGATSHDVYFGTTSPGSFQGNQTAITFDPGTMAYDTTYYWRIDEVNTTGTTTGNVWTFTTETTGGGAPIEFDNVSSNAVTGASTTLSWSHTVGTGSDRILIVGIAGEDGDESDLIISSVTYGSANMTFVSGSSATGGTGVFKMKTELYYLLNPDSGTDTVTVTYSAPVTSRCGGTISLSNVKQQTAEAVATSANESTNNISTNITTQTDGAWVVDVVGCGSSGSFTTTAAGMTERFDVTTIDSSGAGSTKPVASAGSTTMSWEHTGANRMALSVAAFAPTGGGGPTPPGLASNPSPADTATDVSVDADLSWNAGSGATSHDVYFGTSSPGSFQGNQTATTFNPGTMSNDTTYYWRLDEINAAGTTTGTVWSFTTVAVPAGDVEIIGSWVSGTSHAAEAGTNRLLIFTTHAEDNNADMNITSVTYGGQTMTKVIDENEGTGYRAYAGLFILDEAGINAASGSSFVVTWAEIPNRTPGFSSAFLQNVDQTSPVGASASNGGTTANISTSALSTNDGDMVVLAATCGNTGTYSVNNGFIEAIELSMTSADGVAGYKAATGANETPSITHSNVNRQVVIGFVVQAQ
ncbi:MAG: beta strand repeat-containing protein, partial [Planctomycetota bacterium]